MSGRSFTQLEVAVSLKPVLIPPVPDTSSQVAQLPFPKKSLALCDELGVILASADFAHLVPE
jgi:hypothetical protein